MGMSTAGRKGRPLWQWILLGLLLFVISVALLVIGFFRFSQTGRELRGLFTGTVELMQISATNGQHEAKTPMGQWFQRVQRSLQANQQTLDAGRKELAASGFLAEPALTPATDRAKTRKAIDHYASILRSVQSANAAIEGTARSELTGLPIPSGARAGLQEVWDASFNPLLATMNEKLVAEEAFVTYAGAIYRFLAEVEANAGYRATSERIQFNSAEDADTYRQAQARLQILRDEAQAAHDRHMEQVDSFQQSLQSALEDALR